MRVKQFIFLFSFILFSISCKVKETPIANNSVLGTWYMVHVDKNYGNINIDCDIEKGKIKWVFTEDLIEIENNNEDDTCPSVGNATVSWEPVIESNNLYLGGPNYMSGKLIINGDQLILDYSSQISTDLSSTNRQIFER